MKSTIYFLVIMAFILGSVSPIYSQNSEQLYQKGLMKEEGEGELSEAIVLYNQIVENQDAAKSLQAKALLHIGMCYEKMGMQEATKAYQNLVNNFPRQESEVAIAKERLSHLILISEKVSKTPLTPKFRKLIIPTKLFWTIKLSPDGKEIFFPSTTDKKIWKMDLLGKLGSDFPGIPMKLNTEDIRVDWSGLAISADGNWIAFNERFSDNPNDEREDSICIVSTDGGKPKRIIESFRDARIVNYKISLSPDGKTLAYSSVENDECHIYTISVDGGSSKKLIDAQAREPVFSPDGKMIAFVDTKNLGRAGGGLWVIPTSNGAPKLVANAENATSPIWSPNSDMIAFQDNDQVCIASITIEGTELSEVIKIDIPKNTGGLSSLAGWTPDNKICIVFRMKTVFGLYTVPVTGGKSALISHSGYPTQPRWSPDGKNIFHTNKIDEGSGDWEGFSLAVVPTEGGKVKTIPIQFEDKIVKPSYRGGNNVSPDGKMIVFSGQSKKDTTWHNQIWTLDIDGGTPKQITETPESIFNGNPCWSPDGKFIAYISANADSINYKGFTEVNICIISANGGNPKVLTSDTDSVKFCPIAWSPDGKLIAYFSKDTTNRSAGILKIHSLNDGVSRVLAKLKTAHNHREIAWSPDSKRIAFNYGPGMYGKLIRIISIDDGSFEDIKTGLKDVKMYHLDWSPDGERFAFSGFIGDAPELWLLENFLPLDKLAQKNKEKSIEVLKKMEQHLKEGNRLFDLWEYKLAIEEYKSAIELDPNSLMAQNAHYRIGQSLFKEAQYDHALTTFNKLIKEFPESVFVPVTELMITQVEHAIANNQQLVQEINADKNIIVDPETGIAYRKIKSFAGKNDWITYTSGGFNMSPDCRFLVHENSIVPVDGSDAFKLVDMNALRAVYSPKMNNAAFYADSSIWMVPVSPESGRSIGNPKKLLEGSYKYQGPVNWSPDGKKIVFVRREINFPENAWALNILDNSLSQITEIEGVKRSPVWSPNGKSIIYNSEGTIWQTAENIKEPKIVVENQGRAIPHWSPDGKWLYLISNNDNYLYSFEDKKEFKLRHPKQIGRFCSFTPNGDELLFYRSSFDDKWGMKVISSLGGPSFSPALNCEVYYSQWSRDSKNMLAMSVNVKGDLTFKVIPFAGGNPVEVKIDVKVNGKPIPIEASPDLTQLIFSVKLADGLKDLYIVPLSIQKGKTMGSGRLIFEDCLSNVRLSWSPDGSKLALLHDGDIWIVPLNGEDPSQVTDTPENERWVEWSPNSKMISYIIESKQSGLLYIMNLNTENSTIINNNCEGSEWSPDSKSLAVSSLNKLFIIGLDGNKIYDFELSKEIDITNISDLSFSPKGKYFAFHSYTADEESIIYLYSFETKEIIRLGDDDLKYSLVWSPDGKWLSYLTYQQEKVRPEGTLWEADFAEIKEKLLNNK